MSPHLLPNFRLLPGMLVKTTGRKIPFRVGAKRTVGRGQFKQTQVYLVHPKHGLGWWTPIGDVTGIVADDPATGGCLAVLLGASAWRTTRLYPAGERPPWLADTYFSNRDHNEPSQSYPTLGAACVTVAVALGRWPGGEK
jgi:hypothetical protein